ncbi:hypothetical protein [Neogemmobacter tilapiae]|uniref:Uncharacterized protein n=1 Tax=Neogemmobacter tilapiae TaxID=875041 RepID=A0A918TK58_9RHOB|nr:hypothetical protein [Gemmobacter tilapiae]GHC45588.1 hypothetical protein GCM10007315_03820 [Gemmobacter tilapiae]
MTDEIALRLLAAPIPAKLAGQLLSVPPRTFSGLSVLTLAAAFRAARLAAQAELKAARAPKWRVLRQAQTAARRQAAMYIPALVGEVAVETLAGHMVTVLKELAETLAAHDPAGADRAAVLARRIEAEGATLAAGLAETAAATQERPSQRF